MAMLKQLIRKWSRAGRQEGEGTSSEAAKVFIQKSYECYDVLGYMAKKYDIKGEIGIGEKSIGADKGIP